jgi:hypothetical protein
MAAGIALVVGLLLPLDNGQTVHAAVILAKLDKQIAESSVVEITLDSLTIDGEVTVNGTLQVGEGGIAGDIHAIVHEGHNGNPVEVDISLGMSADQRWVLIRKLSIPEPEIQPILAFLFPAGSETLLMLPIDDDGDGIASGIAEGLSEGLSEPLAMLNSKRVVSVLEELIEARTELGATVVDRADGTVELTVPIRDARALKTLESILEGAFEATEGQEDNDATTNVRRHGSKKTRVRTTIEIDEADEDDLDADNDLIGATLSVVYDPDTESVRSFSISDLGSTEGTLSVVIRDGEIDADLLDSSRVITPNTRTLDLGAIEAMFEGFGAMRNGKD